MRERPAVAGFASPQTKANAKQTLQESAGTGGWEKAVSAQIGRRSVDQVSESQVQRNGGTGLSPRCRSEAVRPDGARHCATAPRQWQDGESARICQTGSVC